MNGDYRELDCNHYFLKNGYCMLCGYCHADPTKAQLDIDGMIEAKKQIINYEAIVINPPHSERSEYWLSDVNEIKG